MLKKVLGLFLVLLALAPGKARAISDDRSKPDIWAVSNRSVGTSTTQVRVDYNGNLLPGRNVASDVGESTHAWRKVYSGQLNVSSGILNVHEDFAQIKSSGATDSGSFTISTTALAASGTTYAVQDITQSTTPRNVVLQSSFSVGMATTIVTCVGTVYGTNAMGNPNASETINFSTTPGIGSVAWASISSVTISNSSTSITGEVNTVIKMGTGNKIGLANGVSITSDVYKVTTSSGNIPITSVTVDAVNDTIDFGSNFPNSSRDFHVWYKAKNSPF